MNDIKSDSSRRSSLLFWQRTITNQKKNPEVVPVKTSIFSQSQVYIPIRIFFVILLAIFVLLGIKFRNLPPVVPLYYSLPWGDEQLVSSYYLFILPSSLILLFILNYLVSKFITSTEILLVQILMWATTFSAVLSFVSLVNIILLVS